MSGVVEFNMSDGLPPLVMQKLNANFKSLGNIDDLSGGKLLTGTVLPDNAADGAFFYNTETGDLSVWRNLGEAWGWSSATSSDIDALEVAVHEALEVVEATSQHFWTDDLGAHVTDVTKDDWLEQIASDDPFADLSDQKPYHNLLLNSLGILMRTALMNLVSITRSSISFYDGEDNDVNNIVALFGRDGVRLGPPNDTHSIIDSGSYSILNADEVKTISMGKGLVNIQNDVLSIHFYNYRTPVFETGTPVSEVLSLYIIDNDDISTLVPESQISITGDNGTQVQADVDWELGYEAILRYKTSLPTVAFAMLPRTVSPNYGFGSASLNNSTASGMFALASGDGCIASGMHSVAEGVSTVASGGDSHAEGNSTRASNWSAHAEGRSAIASGPYSHAQNYRTIAASNSQTVIGTYNKEDDSSTTTHPSGNVEYGQYALIIGNGTANNARSNALGVQWDGRADMTNMIRRTTAGAQIGATRESALWNNLIMSSDDEDGFVTTGHVHLREVYGTAGEYSTQLEVGRFDTSKGTVYNGVRMGISNAGIPDVSLNHPAAWRKALGMPAGIILMYGGATAPTGWLWCNGQAVSRTTYAELFAAIGTTWGAGDGSTTFNVPDLRGRAPIGAGHGTGLTNRTLGTHNIGAETHTLNANQIPAHTHGSKTLTGGFRARHYGTSGDGYQLVFTPNGIVDVDAHTGTLGKVNIGGIGNNGGYEQVTVNATHTHDSVGGGQAHNNMQPSAVVNFIISYGLTI